MGQVLALSLGRVRLERAKSFEPGDVALAL